MKPLEVLHVHSGNIFGGVETILVTIARNAALVPAARHRFALGWTGQLSAELTKAGAHVSVLGAARLSRPWTVWGARGQLRRLLAREPADVAVVHSSWSAAVFGPAVERAGVPIVRWAHSALPGPAAIERRAHRIPPRRIIAVSEFVAGQVRVDYAGTPVEVVHAPVEPPPPVDRAATRAALGVPADLPLILHVGRLEIWKGQRVLLDALGALRDIAWRVAFAGGAQSDDERAFAAELARRASALGIADRVSWLGHRGDVPALLAASDVVALPSTAPEGMSMAVVEAMYAGRAIVVTDIGPNPEILDAASAVLVPPNDAPALAAALRRALGDPPFRERIGAVARQRTATFAPEPQLRAIAASLTRAVQS